MRRGFRFSEKMSGTFVETGEAGQPQRRLSFTVEAHTTSWLDYMRTGRTAIRGTLEADGFADGVPLEGHLILLPLTRRIIRYAFNFTANDGNPYRFAGQKEIRFFAPMAGFTHLPAGIYDASGREVATCRLHFNVRRHLVPFLASWRLA